MTKSGISVGLVRGLCMGRKDDIDIVLTASGSPKVPESLWTAGGEGWETDLRVLGPDNLNRDRDPRGVAGMECSLMHKSWWADHLHILLFHKKRKL